MEPNLINNKTILLAGGYRLFTGSHMEQVSCICNTSDKKSCIITKFCEDNEK